MWEGEETLKSESRMSWSTLSRSDWETPFRAAGRGAGEEVAAVDEPGGDAVALFTGALSSVFEAKETRAFSIWSTLMNTGRSEAVGRNLDTPSGKTTALNEENVEGKSLIDAAFR